MSVTTKQPPVVCIMGPTASGKTALAMELYDSLPCDIISVDSALIYRDMDIGTAKPTAQELEQYPHQLIDILDASENYSVADFCKDALAAIEQSRANNRIPILVGYSMQTIETRVSFSSSSASPSSLLFLSSLLSLMVPQVK